MQPDDVLGAFEVNERCMEANRSIGYRVYLNFSIGLTKN